MNKLNEILDSKHGNKIQSVSDNIIFLSLLIVWVIAISIFAFDLFSNGSENYETENVAIESYKSYSKKLEAISDKYAKELETNENGAFLKQ
jgi:hypothetical protein